MSPGKRQISSMCGISGLLKNDGGHADRDQLSKMIATPHHRGPDANGIHVSGAVGLAHARLSIIDLQSGAQPMSTAEGLLWITFNGEIFNYVELREELLNKGHRFLTGGSAVNRLLISAFFATLFLGMGIGFRIMGHSREFLVAHLLRGLGCVCRLVVLPSIHIDSRFHIRLWPIWARVAWGFLLAIGAVRLVHSIWTR